MNKTLISIIVGIIALVTSCSDDNTMFTNPTPIRTYERDARIMAQFVEVDKASGTYVLNPDRKIHATDYVVNRSREELMEVSQINKDRFLYEMEAVNSQLNVMRRSGLISASIYSTQTYNTVIDIKEEDSFFISKLDRDSYCRSDIATLTLADGITEKVAFDSASSVVINVKASGCSTFYLAQMTIGDRSNENEEIIIISGIKSFIPDHSYRLACSSKLARNKVISGTSLIGDGNVTISFSR